MTGRVDFKFNRLNKHGQAFRILNNGDFMTQPIDGRGGVNNTQAFYKGSWIIESS